MREFPVVAVLWEDHISYHREEIFKNPEDGLIKPVLSVGILYKKTKKTLLLVSDIERYMDHDEASFIIILRSTVVSIKKYGTIELSKLTSH